MEIQKDNQNVSDSISCAITSSSAIAKREEPMEPPKAPKMRGINPLYDVQSFVLPLSAKAASQLANSCKDDYSQPFSSCMGQPLSFTQGLNEFCHMSSSTTQMQDTSSFQQVYEALIQQQ